MSRSRKNIFLVIFSGILTFLAFPPVKLSFLAWISLVPLFIVIRDNNRKSSFWYSYLSGLVFFGLLISWLVNVTVPGSIILVILLALFYGLFGLAARIVFKYSMDLLILPFIWVVLEYIRSHLLTGFPWGLLGYSQYANIKIIQVADITGVYGISFMLVMFNVAVYAVIVRSKRKISYMMSALLFLIVIITYGVYRLDNFSIWGKPRISVIQGNIPQKFKWDPGHAKNIIEKYDGLTRQAAGDKPDMIVWPETAYPYLVEEGAGAVEIEELARDINIPILAGIVYEKKENFYNSAFLFSSRGAQENIYNKIHLVPFGEYIPFGKYFSFLRGYIDKPIGDFTASDDFTLFVLRSTEYSEVQKDVITHTTLFYKFGVLICFEDIFPYITRRFVSEGANIMINMTNDAWFGNTAAAEQHLQASVFRAVENRVPVIRAANTGVSCFINPTGKILSRVADNNKDIFIEGFATENVQVTSLRSFYTKYGDAFVYFCAFMMVILIATEWFLVKE